METVTLTLTRKEADLILFLVRARARSTRPRNAGEAAKLYEKLLEQAAVLDNLNG